MAKILVIEDDKGLALIVEEALSQNHYTVETVHDGTEGMYMLRHYVYDAAIIDIDLPGMNGLEICRNFRVSGGKTPILMLTGHDTVSDRELGLDMGAADYICKPFHIRELLARVRSVLRRGTEPSSSLIKVGRLELDSARFTLTVAGLEVEISRTDFALLEFFMRHPNETFSSDALLKRVWADGSHGGDDAVRSSLRRIRKMIDEPDHPSLIQNIYGVGYRFHLPGEPQ